MNADDYTSLAPYLTTADQSRLARVGRGGLGGDARKRLLKNLSNIENLPEPIADKVLSGLSLNELCASNLSKKMQSLQRKALASGIENSIVDGDYVLLKEVLQTMSNPWEHMTKNELVNLLNSVEIDYYDIEDTSFISNNTIKKMLKNKKKKYMCDIISEYMER